MAHNVLTEEGDFAGDMRGKFFAYSSAYPNAGRIVGAPKMGRVGVAGRGRRLTGGQGAGALHPIRKRVGLFVLANHRAEVVIDRGLLLRAGSQEQSTSEDSHKGCACSAAA